MNRASFRKIDGSLVEIQSGGDLVPERMEWQMSVLRNNAINAGHNPDDLEFRWISDEEFAALTVMPERNEQKEEALLALNDLDRKSIRAIREWLVEQPTCPQFLKNYENQAKAERAKLK